MAQSENFKKDVAKLRKLQNEEEQERIDELKDKYGIGEECTKELTTIISEAYHVKNIIELFSSDQLEVRSFNLSYALTTQPVFQAKPGLHDGKNHSDDRKEYEHQLNCWVNMINYFLPSWFYLTISKKTKKYVIGVDWFKYMKLFFKKRPFETFPLLPQGIEYKENFGAWKILEKNELDKTYNKYLIKMMEKWGLARSNAMNNGIGQTRKLSDALILNRSANEPEDLLNQNLVAFKNGTYNFKTGELQPHNKRDYLLNLHDYSIDLDHPHAPNTDKLLRDMMGNASTFFKEFIGYCYYPSHSMFQDFIILNGDGGEGKSTLLNYISQDLFSKKNFSALDPQTIADRNNRFATSDLYGKEINIVPDISDKMLKDVAPLKGLVGGDPIRAEEKGQPSFNFISRAKNIWSANKLPALRSSDVNRALEDRANILKLVNGDTRSKNNDFWQKHDMDKVRSERPQFVAECLNLFHEVMKRHQQGLGRSSWTRPASINQDTSEWFKHNNPVQLWLDSVKEENPQLLQDGYFIKDQAFADYRYWCSHEERSKLNKGNFGKALCSNLGFENKRVHLDDGSFRYCWVNHGLKKQWDKDISDWNKKCKDDYYKTNLQD
ncbi:hypothetical protein FD27_GL001670 [Limosilactobacillus frumenti DSM 13145]|jgi:putative DNA primase/helicase|uniref:SF3 helicase domain-containing protein n=1 Tax=Limosilactobacillus frumenti DSM 13145 TaxID=1423746 RepID=A0A0R1P874_9LACO|nr:phage/plasmid primase, P4 family [Limosilactobacillus frumenti]KRL28670.1 hypothetical protein FD27_GL001670 [Limosilactobacillus frumenti DSM 13145]QFG72262.1 hypothetical protein LF145_02350 [Limosilactobacillus frumenti]